MTRVGVFVGEQGNWSFFRELYDHLRDHYDVEAYQPKTYTTPLLHGRLNRWAFRHNIQSMLRRSDVCFFEWASELLVPASNMTKHCPIVTRLHSFELFAWAPQVNWNHVDHIILVSKAMQDKFANLYPDHAHKTEVIYNAKRLDVFKPANRTFQFNLGMIAEIIPRKRIYEIILMVHELRQAGINTHLHIAGARKHAPGIDEYYVACQRLVEKLCMGNDITFHGRVERTAEWLRDIDIFISNSFWEGHQVALVEAMATGCMCYSHFWDGAEEVLPPDHLYTTEAELKTKIVTFSRLPDEKKAQQFAEMSAIARERYDIEQQKEKIQRVIERLATQA